MKLSVLMSPAFNEAFSKLMAADLPIKVSFKLNKFVKAIQPELEMFQEQRKKVFEQFAVKDEEGNTVENDGMITLNPELKDQWMPKLLELEELTTDSSFKVDVNDLEGVKLSASDLIVLEDLLEGLE